MVSDRGIPPADPDPSRDEGRLQELRDILLREDEAYLADTVKSVLAEATALRVGESKDQMARALAPVLGEAIRRQIQESQDDIVDALYPIIGKSIQRAVAEAMRSLAQRVDQRLRSTFSVRRVVRRIQARVQGMSEAELLLRDALPFQVQQVFLIHRTSGVLLQQLAGEKAEDTDSDLISAMLTAIRDFAQDSFGPGREGDLDEIQYGDLSILVEPGPWAYLAVVIEGVEPEGYRHRMRSALSDVHRAHSSALEHYDGDASRLIGVEDCLRPLLNVPGTVGGVRAEARPPWLAIAAAGAATVLCLSLGCWGAWRLTWGRPRPTAVVVAPAVPSATASPSSTATIVPPTATFTASPTASVAPTATPTLTDTPSPRPTFTPTPPASATPTPFVGVMIGSAWLRLEPRNGSKTTGDVVDRARPVEVLAIYQTWYLIRWPPGDPGGTTGWVPGQWVGLVVAPPPAIITPGP